MPLVDYDSDSSSEEDSNGGARTGSGSGATRSPPTREPHPANSLPPLPAAFHDLYASSVRTSTVDDPSLHNGRRRTTPHTPGTWPSHIYIEWHPETHQQATLARFLDAIAIPPSSPTNDPIHSLLTSDLSVPLPLHISLSRPLSLTTSNKDAFLRAVQDRVAALRIRPFTLRVTGADWYWGGEYGSRAFLVLRLREETRQAGRSQPLQPANPTLAALLAAVNAVAADFGQTPLYARSRTVAATNTVGESDGGTKPEDPPSDSDAFHISIAWSLTAPTPELESATAAALADKGIESGMSEMAIPVHGVKVKIGNLVTHIALAHQGRDGPSTSSLFGL